MMISFTDTRKTPASSSMSWVKPFRNSATRKRTKVRRMTRSEPASRYVRRLAMGPPGVLGLLELEGGGAQAAEQLARGLETPVVGRRHHRPREGVPMPALERQLLENAAPARQAQGALGGHEAHVGRVGLDLVDREHGGLAVARHLHAGRLVQEQPGRADL